MDTKTHHHIKIVQSTDPDRSFTVVAVNATTGVVTFDTIKAMPKKQRLDWLNRKQRRAEAAKKRKSQ
jgi:hypothetical protein